MKNTFSEAMLAILMIVILFLSCTANAGLITLNNAHEINTLSLSQSFTSFYSYGSPYGSSANTGYEQENTAVLFLAEANGELALFTLLDARGGAKSTRRADLTLSDFDLSNVLLVDDAKESNDNGFKWRWFKCCTDGMIYKINDKTAFDIDISFSNVVGLGRFKFLSFTSGPSQPKELIIDSAFSIQSVSGLQASTAVPEPSTFMLFIVALIGIRLHWLKRLLNCKLLVLR